MNIWEKKNYVIINHTENEPSNDTKKKIYWNINNIYNNKKQKKKKKKKKKKKIKLNRNYDHNLKTRKFTY